VKKLRPGRIKLNFEFFSIQFLFFLSSPTLKGKLGIFVMTTSFLDEVGLRHQLITISYLDQSYVPSCGKKQFVQMRQHAKK
jgi:hypothetical protein